MVGGHGVSLGTVLGENAFGGMGYLWGPCLGSMLGGS